MIKVTALYPYDESKKFDIDYYCNIHLPMVQGMLGSALKSVSVDYGLNSGAPGSKPAYVALANLLFDTMESFQAAIGPHMAEMAKDSPNYTDIVPLMQISEVRI